MLQAINIFALTKTIHVAKILLLLYGLGAYGNKQSHTFSQYIVNGDGMIVVIEV